VGQYLGLVALESAIPIPALTKNTSGVPTNPTSAPTYRIYGPSGLMQNGTGSLSQKDTGTITNATNASPIVITEANHGLTTGTEITVTGVGGNTAANGTWVITVVDANTYQLNSSTGNGAYTSGGTRNVSGLYSVNVTCGAANGYASGQTYVAYIQATVGSNQWGDVHTFTVI
jgi:hypothetical protein